MYPQEIQKQFLWFTQLDLPRRRSRLTLHERSSKLTLHEMRWQPCLNLNGWMHGGRLRNYSFTMISLRMTETRWWRQQNIQLQKRIDMHTDDSTWLLHLVSNHIHTSDENHSYLYHLGLGNQAKCPNLKAGKGCQCSSPARPNLLWIGADISFIRGGVGDTRVHTKELLLPECWLGHNLLEKDRYWSIQHTRCVGLGFYQ